MHGHKLTKLLIGGVTGFLIIAAFGVFYWTAVKSPQEAAPELQSQNSAAQQSSESRQTTRGPIPYDAVVPEKNSTHIAADTAVPVIVAPAGPKTTALFRSFVITAANDAFTPSTIVVYRNDTVSINLTAQDHDYTFVQPDYGFNVVVKKGESKTIEFGATAAGTFTYYCSICENKKVEGKLLITEHD